MRRTTINLDADLVAEAREVLETKNTTDTVHRALREVVRREDLRRLTEWELEGLTLEGIKEMRRSRVETRPWGRWRDEFDVMDVFRGGSTALQPKDPSPVAKRAAPSSRRKSSAANPVKRGRAAAG
ncbi:MAG TPA: type II toxin-antitoxin system VapB family antitoxin [Solirubrobacteraceae bacterium]|nr:type II toxin-antitoxin system VapB family antitoxin [Solirubrobacteraceae bacterium]